MAGAGAFEVEGVIVAALPNRTYQVELANGHRLLGFVPGRARAQAVRLAAGERVRLRLSAYDLSEGRIILETETK
jgi:translation initiation factor IF-1